MKITYNDGQYGDITNIVDIPIGAVFSGEMVNYSIYWRMYDTVIDLQDPNWSMPKDFIAVRNYKKLSAELIVRDEKK